MTFDFAKETFPQIFQIYAFWAVNRVNGIYPTPMCVEESGSSSNWVGRGKDIFLCEVKVLLGF